MVQSETRKNFVQQIEAGFKLNLKDNQCLNSILKKDYVYCKNRLTKNLSRTKLSEFIIRLDQIIIYLIKVRQYN